MIHKLSVFPVLFIKESLNIDLDQMRNAIIESRSTQDHYTSYHNKDNDRKIHDIPGIGDLRREIGRLSDVYLKEIGVRKKTDQYHVQMWWNIYDQHQGHQLHNHPGSLLSGTFYVTMDEDCSKITFQSPYAPMCMHMPPSTDRYNEFFTYDYKPKVESGDILLWPSWVWHMVPQQKDPDKLRITVSFNVDMR